MKITNNIHYPKLYYNQYQQTNNQTSPINVSPNNIKNTVAPKIDYSQIAFGAIYNVKTKKINIEAEKTKLLKQISEMLDVDIEDTDIEDIVTNAVNKALQAFRTKIRKQEELLRKADELIEDKTLSQIQKYERANQLKKEAKKLEKPLKTFIQKSTPKAPDERIDYQLLNKFKTAIGEDSFNLQKIMQEYYSELNNITTIEELNKKYPKIKTPKRPEQVIAEKITSTLTRDFYEKLDKIYKNGTAEELQDFVIDKIALLCDSINLKYIDPKTFAQKIVDPTVNEICQKYVTAKKSGSFSTFPEIRKIKTPQITDTDMKLLSIDYDDFVLSVIRKHYLDSQKINDITYKSGDITISMGELRSTDYKFDKMSDKMKGIVNNSKKLFTAQRNYENYDIDEFRTRLNFFANRELSNDETILKNIIDFDECSFTDEDISMLIKFLKELDKINDGEKTLQDGVDTIHFSKLRPKGTEKLNDIKRQKSEAKYKQKQQEAFKLNEVKDRFDNVINLLYENNLNNIASTCSKYRPTSIDEKEIDNANHIIETITQCIENNEQSTINKTKLETSISRWETFNYYKKNDPQNPVYKKAIQYATSEDSSIDINKAGQYIINAELVKTYPESLGFTTEPEILERIMEKASNSEEAINYLSKFDDYKTLSSEEKSHLSKLLEMFDLKDNLDKTILKHIIEKDYAKTNTKVLTNIHDNSDETIPAEFMASAKQQIIDKYKFPTCIQYLSAFEDALSSLATTTGTSGIKMTSKNNKTIEYKMELKIKGHDDRLFSSNNDYRFDIFSDRGMH